MSDLAAQLREVIEERLRVAREAMAKAGHGAWRLDAGRATGNRRTWYCVRAEGKGVMVCDDALGEQVARHIALNDPADAILAGEWALGVLERHAPTLPDGCEAGCCEWYPYPDPEHIGPAGDGEWRPQGWPCAEILAMAKRYGVSTDG